ncbi:MAG: hypothetical protein KBG15_22650 [Kofleriaceae bacterium]|nr:hypothetical protein [Kofleriaceae bacterium]
MAVGRWPLAVGRWPLAVGRWPLAVGRWPLAVGLSFQLFSSGCGSSSSDGDEPAAALTEKASSALCAKLGTRIVDDRVADLTMLTPTDRAAQRVAAEQAIGVPFMQSCVNQLTVGQVRCGIAATDSAEIAACIAAPAAQAVGATP